jgi:hypothetical protein
MRYKEVDGRYRRTKPRPKPSEVDGVDWTEVDYIVGTRDDVTQTGIHRPCTRCQHDVFTSKQYPETVPMICEVCALALAVEENEAKENGDDDEE